MIETTPTYSSSIFSNSQWAVTIRIDKTVRLRIPGFVLAQLYKIKEATSLSISAIIRIMIQECLKDPVKLQQIIQPYALYNKKHKRKRNQKPQPQPQP
jgi:TfoX/Sxy family transcriptional regulator of competence genes